MTGGGAAHPAARPAERGHLLGTQSWRRPRPLHRQGSTPGPSALGIIAAVLLILAPIATAVHLGRRASTNAGQRRRGAQAW